MNVTIASAQYLVTFHHRFDAWAQHMGARPEAHGRGQWSSSTSQWQARWWVSHPGRWLWISASGMRQTLNFRDQGAMVITVAERAAGIVQTVLRTAGPGKPYKKWTG